MELTFAGGYDPRLRENVVTYDALKVVTKLGTKLGTGKWFPNLLLPSH